MADQTRQSDRQWTASLPNSFPTNPHTTAILTGIFPLPSSLNRSVLGPHPTQIQGILAYPDLGQFNPVQKPVLRRPIQSLANLSALKFVPFADRGLKTDPLPHPASPTPNMIACVGWDRCILELAS
jgi:hypothetical protein